MILVTVLDGLRPDMITPEHMPFLAGMREKGVCAQAGHAVYPTVTRVNAASLTTGCYPGRHGIVGNSLYVPEVDPRTPLSCADWRALQALARSEGGRLLTASTLGEILARAGRHMVSAGSGSPGTTYLTNPTLSGPVINWATAWPDATAQTVADRYGGFLDHSASGLERTDYVLRGLREILVPLHQPDVIVAWITEPDHTQHAYGLGSPEALTVLRKVDQRLESLVAFLNDALEGSPDCFCISDHGFSTLSHHLDLDQTVSLLGDEGIVVTHSGLYTSRDLEPHFCEMVDTMLGSPLLGALFVRDDLSDLFPGALHQGDVFGSHRRSPALLFSGRWSEGYNDHRVPGVAAGPSTHLASHGSASPYDIRNTMIAWGPHFRQGVLSTVPCGIVDVTPTILHLLGIPVPDTMDGRVLAEWLHDGEPGSPENVRTETRAATFQRNGHDVSHVAHYSLVGQHTYLDWVSSGSLS